MPIFHFSYKYQNKIIKILLFSKLFENYKSSSLAIVNTLKVKAEFKKSLADFIEMIFQREF